MASFSDDFNRADSSDLGAAWIEVSGEWSIASNRLSPGAAGGTIILRAADAMASSDNFAQVAIAVTASASQGVWCRGNSNISQGYLWRNDGSTWNLFAVVGGSFTSIGSYAAAAAPGDVAKVQAVGSTIKGYVNGVERVSVTDTSVTTGTSVGIRSESVGALRYDDFAAGDVTVGATLDVAITTEVAQTLTGAKAATLDIAAEIGGAQTLDGIKAAALTPATAQEAAQPLTGAKTAALAPVAEQSAAQGLAGVKTGALSTTGTTETAQPLTGVKTATLPVALEISTARPLTRQSTVTPSPERTYRIPAEDRRFAVAAEQRTFIVR